MLFFPRAAGLILIGAGVFAHTPALFEIRGLKGAHGRVGDGRRTVTSSLSLARPVFFASQLILPRDGLWAGLAMG